MKAQGGTLAFDAPQHHTWQSAQRLPHIDTKPWSQRLCSQEGALTHTRVAAERFTVSGEQLLTSFLSFSLSRFLSLTHTLSLTHSLCHTHAPTRVTVVLGTLYRCGMEVVCISEMSDHNA